MLNSRTNREMSTSYLILIISLCASYVFYKFVLQTYPGIITNELTTEFHLSAAGLGNLAAMFYYTYMITQLFVGFMLDKYGVRWLTSFAIFNCALGLLLFSQAHSLLIAELSRALMGIGVSFATVTYLKLAALWIKPRYYAFVNGLLASAAMAGAVFGEAPLSWFINQIGWRQSLTIVSISGFVLALVFICAVVDTSSAEKNSQENTISFRDVLQIFKNKQNWLLTLYGGFAFSPLAVFGGLWGNPFLQQAYHLSKVDAASLISLIFIGFGLGSPLIGILSDRIHRHKEIILVGTVISCIALSLVLYCHTLPLWLVEMLTFTFGFGMGAYMLIFTVGKAINALTLTATVFTMINASDAVLDSITEPVIGRLLDLNWNGTIVNGAHYFSLHAYHVALSVLPIYLIIAILLISFIRSFKCDA